VTCSLGSATRSSPGMDRSRSCLAPKAHFNEPGVVTLAPAPRPRSG
jgi:hypothetical protein